MAIVAGGLVLVLAVVSVVVIRGVRRIARQPIESVDFWRVADQPRPVVETYFELGFTALGAVRVGTGEHPSYYSICWSEELRTYARLFTVGDEAPLVDGGPMFVSRIGGGTLHTRRTVPEGIVPGQLEQGFPGFSEEALLVQHRIALAFLSAHDLVPADSEPTDWFEDLRAERAAEADATDRAGTMRMLWAGVRLLARIGDGPLSDQRHILRRIGGPPFTAS